MNINYLTHQIHGWWQQVQALQRRPRVSSTQQDQRDPLLENAFEALSTAWEELCMATETLQQQHEEVAATRQAVEAEHQRYQELFDFAPDGYLVTDLSGSIQEANHAAGTLLNMRQDHLVGKPLMVLIAKGDRKQFWTQLTQLQEGKRIEEWQVRVQPRRRASISAAFTAAPARDAQGGLIGFRWLFRDITARRQLEEQLTYAQKMEAVGRLATGMAHEFSNQLTVISVHSQLLRQHLDDGHPLHQYAEELRKAVERATVLTTRLLTFSCQPVQQSIVLDLNIVIANLAPMLRRLIGEEIDLVIRAAPDLGRVHADPGQIEQVVLNLAVNARDAMLQGGQLAFETANIEVDERYMRSYPGVHPGPYVRLAVSDTGGGIDAATQSRLFEPFFTTKGPSKGTGLGLFIVYGIIRQSHGHIFVDSALGRGSTFTILLPSV